MPKINELTRAQTLAATDLFAAENTSGTSTRGVSAQQIKDFATGDVSAEVTDLKNALETGIIDDTETVSAWQYGYRHGNNGGIAPSTNTVVTTSPITLAVGLKITISDGFKLFIADSSGAYPSGFQWQTGTWYCNLTGAYYLELRHNDNTDISSLDDVANVVSVSTKTAWNVKTAYVATTGSDANDGTIDHPFATITQAIDYGARKIMIAGGVYTETIDLQNIIDTIALIAYEPLTRVIIKAPDNVIATSASLLSGYTRVKSCSLTKSISVNNLNMYQEGVPDESTLITDAERMPIQRGYAYRCEDTLISKCAATSVNNALTEIENSDSYLWYYDTANNTLYFSSPSDVSTSNPITYSPGTHLFDNLATGATIHAYGIETKYHMFNVSQTVDSVISHCKSGNVFGYGSFVYDRCKNVKFESCEAYRCVQNNSGDGFNGHGTNSGETFAYQVTCELYNCWAHDNKDDGYSDHEHAETIINGGLYEYNGKAGVTPSYGSHCVCYNVYSRNNYAGFYYYGTAEAVEGGKYGQVMCYNCIADGNTRGGTNTGFRCGGNGNTMKLYDCLSINNGYAVGTDQNGGRIHVYGLKTGNNANNIDGYATRIDIIESADFAK